MTLWDIFIKAQDLLENKAADPNTPVVFEDPEWGEVALEKVEYDGYVLRIEGF